MGMRGILKSTTTSVLAAAAISSAPARADVKISDKPTQNMSCAAGVCTATANKAVLNVSDLANMLASGDVEVRTGGVAKDIEIDAALGWASSQRLTLTADRSLIVNKPVTVTGTGALTVTTNDGGTGGDLLFAEKGNLTFWDTASGLIINGNSYTLAGDIATLAADIAANPSGFYALANKIDAKSQVISGAAIPTEFSGTFDGLGQVISHLKIKHNVRNREGFFAFVDEKGVVRDLVLKKVNIHASGDIVVGALVGENYGALLNISADGEVNGTAQVTGGIVGENNGGTIENLSSAVNVTSGLFAGGIVGASEFGTITSSHSTGSVAGLAAGGLAGTGSNISLSYATGSVTGIQGAGGLVAGGDHIDQCYATGAVVGADKSAAGGLAGGGSFITNSYATGAVQSGSGRQVKVGGLTGSGSFVSTSYSAGSVAGGGDSEVGGFMGEGHKNSFQDYWDVDTSGTSQACGAGNCAGVSGLTTDQLQSGLPAGFDPKIWAEAPEINGGLPYLRANPPQ